jgi:hypothetical protein
VRSFWSGFLAAAVAVMIVLAPAASASPTVHEATRSCADIRSEASTFTVTIEKGNVSCSTARKVLEAFMSGKGTEHGPPDGPQADQTWTVDGWSCGHGAGGGACIHGGANYRVARDQIVAQATG